MSGQYSNDFRLTGFVNIRARLGVLLQTGRFDSQGKFAEGNIDSGTSPALTQLQQFGEGRLWVKLSLKVTIVCGSTVVRRNIPWGV